MERNRRQNRQDNKRNKIIRKEQIELCIQACINSYGGKYGEAQKIFQLVRSFSIRNVEGYIGIDNGFLYIVFRGSDGVGDWIDNFKFWKKAVPYDNMNKKIKVHIGFIKQYKLVRGIIFNFVRESGLSNIIVTGHSLGGALATLCSVDIQYNFYGKEVSCITFGSPRVGNYSFVKSYNGRIPNSYRYVNGDDLVCKVPPLLFNYKHVSTKRQIGKRKWWRFISGSTRDHYPKNYKKNLYGNK